MNPTYTVDPDITQATTIASTVYRDEGAYALARQRVFARSWQWIGDLTEVVTPGSLSPRELLRGCLDEPLLLARDRSPAMCGRSRLAMPLLCACSRRC